jgi:hypothetical protein
VVDRPRALAVAQAELSAGLDTENSASFSSLHHFVAIRRAAKRDNELYMPDPHLAQRVVITSSLAQR